MDATDDLLRRLDALPRGASEGLYEGRRYGLASSASPDGRRRRFFAEERGGTDRVSCNLYVLADGRLLLRPCEMEAGKVIDFIGGVRPL